MYNRVYAVWDNLYKNLNHAKQLHALLDIGET